MSFFEFMSRLVLSLFLSGMTIAAAIGFGREISYQCRYRPRHRMAGFVTLVLAFIATLYTVNVFAWALY